MEEATCQLCSRTDDELTLQIMPNHALALVCARCYGTISVANTKMDERMAHERAIRDGKILAANGAVTVGAGFAGIGAIISQFNPLSGAGLVLFGAVYALSGFVNRFLL